MKIIIVFIVMVAINSNAAFTEFYCDNTAGSAGSNVFSGSTSSATPIYSSFSGTWDGTSVFTPTDGSTPANTVTSGDFVSIYTNAVVLTGYIVRVSTVAAGVNGAITCSTASLAGTSPGANTGGMTLRDGGCWHGPGTRDQLGGSGGKTNYFPFDLVAGTLTNTSSQFPRINIKTGTTYNITNAITHSLSGPIRFQGYTTNPGDGGKATIDGGSTGAAYILLTASGANVDFIDLIFSHNGSTSTANGVSLGNECTLNRVVVNNIRNTGIVLSGTADYAIECETYACNSANSVSQAGMSISGNSSTAIRCISHDNTLANTSGFIVSGNGDVLINCISDTNGKDGVTASGVSGVALTSCDFYNNTGSGVDLTGSSSSAIVIQNCNFVKNTAFGINSSGSALRNGFLINNGFGTGTQTNSSGGIGPTAGALMEYGSVTYAADVTPWSDPANGNFSIILSAAKASGRGTFTETAASYSGTIGHPDIGAAQASDTKTTSVTFAQ
jgi:hypothetical protein